MRKRFLRTVLYLLTALSLTGAAYAAESDGWLIRLQPSEDVPLLAGADEMEQVWNQVYRTDDPALVQALENAGLLAYAEPDYIVELQTVPDDPYLSNGTQYWPETVSMGYVWSAGLTGSGIRIGVVDSGLYRDHEDLSGANIIDGWNYCDDNADTSDSLGHGTFVSGIIAAQCSNGTGIAGLAPDVELVPLKSFKNNTSNVSNIVKAIYAAVDDYHCDVLNMSLGLNTDSKTLRDAVAYADSAGVLMIAAVGNLSGTTSTGNDTLKYPAAYESVTGVGAVDSNRVISTFSYQNSSVCVVAPGVSMIGVGYTGSSSYRRGSGTSFATPIVTAAAVFARSLNPSLTNADFQSLLSRTSEDLGVSGYDYTYGYGLLNITNLLLTLRNELEPETIYAYADGLEPETEVLTIAAAYQDSGAMSGTSFQTLIADADGTLAIAIPKPDLSAAKTRLLFLDTLCRPLLAALNV